MKDEKLYFKTNDDPTPISNEDGKLHENILKEMKEMGEEFSILLYFLKEDKLTVGLRDTHVSLMENHLSKIFSMLNYDSYLIKENEEYKSDIRKLNNRARELHKQLGMRISNDDIRERIKLIEASVREWWDKEGTSYLYKDFTFDRRGLHVNFEGYISDAYKSISRNKTVEMLKNKGFDIFCSDRYGYYLSATDNNFKQLKDMFAKKYPNAEIIDINIETIEDILLIKSFNVLFFDLNDIVIEEKNL